MGRPFTRKGDPRNLLIEIRDRALFFHRRPPRKSHKQCYEVPLFTIDNCKVVFIVPFVVELGRVTKIKVANRGWRRESEHLLVVTAKNAGTESETGKKGSQNLAFLGRNIMGKSTSGLAAVVLASAILGSIAAPAGATTITWDLSSPTGNLGNTHTYTSGAYSIVAKGFNNNNAMNPWATADLYGKHDGGDENGLGINSDPTGEHEIYKGTYVQIDVTQPFSQGFKTYQFEMGSSTQGEQWTVYGSNSALPLGAGSWTSLITSTDELVQHTISGYMYYDFTYSGPTNGVGGANVLLYKDFTASSAVPEPATWTMMGLGFAGLGLAGYRSRKRSVSIG